MCHGFKCVGTMSLPVMCSSAAAAAAAGESCLPGLKSVTCFLLSGETLSAGQSLTGGSMRRSPLTVSMFSPETLAGRETGRDSSLQHAAPIRTVSTSFSTPARPQRDVIRLRQMSGRPRRRTCRLTKGQAWTRCCIEPAHWLVLARL